MDARVTTTTAERPYVVITLIGVAHAVSHFYHLAVPVVFPLMKETLGVSYTELGLLATLI
jgi:MFS transporter, FSR family, fosmidomycin resistance protein